MAEQLGQCAEIQRLGEVIIHPGLQALVPVAGHGMGGQGNDGEVVTLYIASRIANLTGGLEAVHAGHLNIHEDQIVGLGGEGGEHRVTIGDDLRLQTQAL